MICAIHQPNFFPWLGYFDKIRRSDIFIFLDQVQFPKNSYVNRVKISASGRPSWLTAPVVVPHLSTVISEVNFDVTKDWKRKHLKTLEVNYRRAAHFDLVFPFIQKLYGGAPQSISAFNMRCVQEIAQKLGCTTRFVTQSQLKAGGEATDLLINLVRAAGGTDYLCGGGADGYQENEKFRKADIRLTYQKYEPTPYSSRHYEPGLSILDFLFESGWDFC